ncbi:MAG: hypothetical protein ACP5EK_00500 [Thermoplasmatota archaeon]
MQKNLHMVVCLVAVAVLVAAMVTPAVGTFYPRENEQNIREKTRVETQEQSPVEIRVTRHGPQGSTATETVLLTPGEAVSLEREMESTSSLGEQLALLVAYGVLPPDASLESIAAEMKTWGAAGRTPASIWLPPLSVSFFSQVSATFRWGTWTRVGMTPFLDLLDRLLGLDFRRGIDLYDFCWGLKGSVTTYGPLGIHRLSLEPGLLIMGGFIGYTVEGLFLRHSFYGAAMVTAVTGLGSHDFDPWFP